MVKKGDTVKVHYKGTLKDGTVFDSSEGHEPLEFTMGEETMIRGFENAIYGMEVGQTRTVSIPAEDAYGPHHDALCLEVKREQLPPGMSPQIGDRLQLRNRTGRTNIVTITKIEGDSITLDGNHPLAGKDLVFEIKLVEIK